MPFASRDPDGVRSEDRIQPKGQSIEKWRKLGRLDDPFHLVFRGIGIRVKKVISYRAGKQLRLLGHVADATPQRSERVLVKLPCFEKDPSCIRICHARKKSGERRLSRPAASDERNLLTSSETKRNIAQDQSFRQIAERHPIALEACCQRSVDILNRAGVGDGRSGIENFVYPSRAGKHPLRPRVEFHGRRYRLEDASHIGIERNQSTDA